MEYVDFLEYEACKAFVNDVNKQNTEIQAGLIGYKDKTGDYFHIDVFVKGADDITSLVRKHNVYVKYEYRNGFRIPRYHCPNETITKCVTRVDGSFCHLGTKYTFKI
jgi:hypothetical protein